MDPASVFTTGKSCRRRGVSGENAPWGLLSQRLLAAVGRRIVWPRRVLKAEMTQGLEQQSRP